MLATYTVERFVVMINYEDTKYYTYSMKKGLTEDRIDQDQLQLQIAFGVFDL